MKRISEETWFEQIVETKTLHHDELDDCRCEELGKGLNGISTALHCIHDDPQARMSILMINIMRMADNALGEEK